MKHIWSITIVLVILTVVSLFNILSLSVTEAGEIDFSGVFSRHLFYILIGWLIYLISMRFNYSFLKLPQVNIFIYLVTIILLGFTLIWGPVINNTQRWLVFGDFQLQVSEIAKIVVIILTASAFYLRYKIGIWASLAVSFISLVPIIALIYIQPHASMTIILFLLWFLTVFVILPNQFRNLILLLILLSTSTFILTLSLGLHSYSLILLLFTVVLGVFTFYARENWRKILGIIFLIGVVLGLSLSFTWHSMLLDYQQDRIYAFLNQTEVSEDLGFNVEQSRIAIGSGQIFGKGWGYGTQSKLEFLPEYKTDFVFASFSEEFGLVGSLTLIFLYGFLIYKLLVLALRYAKMDFEFVVLIGISIKLFLEVFVNIGTNTGVIPATGIPLPIMSYGGTNILCTFFVLGLAQNIVGSNVDSIKEREVDRVDNKQVLI